MTRRPIAAAVRAGSGAALAALMLAGCAGSPPIRYHALSAAPPAVAPMAYDGPVVAIGTVQLPPPVARRELLREAGPGDYRILESDQWAAPLPALVRHAVAEDLQARLPAGKVALPGASWPPARLEVDVAVLALRVAGGTGTATLTWSLRQRPAPGTTAAAPRGEQLQLQVPAGDGPEGTVAAWNAVLGQLADRIAAGLAATPAGS